MKIGFGADHAGFALKEELKKYSETVDYTVKATEYNPKFGAKWNNGKMDIDDILNRRRNLNRSVSGYGYHESFRPQIHSYALVSL